MMLHFHLQYALPLHNIANKEQHEKRLNNQSHHNQSHQEYIMGRILLIILLMENTATGKPYHDII